MTIESDTEWLRSRLLRDEFLRDYAQKWVAVHNGQVVQSSSDLGAMESLLETNDKKKQYILAFCDNRALV
jgi:hypothetical protein